MHPVEAYLEELATLRASGAVVKETSGYPALNNLLNAVGQTLRPKVRCLLQLKNKGAGLPDGGLFTPDQLKRQDDQVPLLGLNPARGVVEVKSTGDELAKIAQTGQIKEYLAHYGLVLLCNYRDFLLIQQGPDRKPRQLESFHLAPDEAAFWAVAAHPRKAALESGERFVEYLKRALLHAAPLTNPRDVAVFLASYARDARSRVENAGDLPALTAVRSALEEALGMKFEAVKGEHFFRSTLVQTLFYGVFSAWVLWHKENPARKDAFDWRAAAWTLHVPMIKSLFEQIATPTKLGPLGLVEVLDWTAAALNRVERAAFFEKFLESHAVQYFYEPFLEEFDPALRKELGVWYTPPEIVQYMVARVDTVLREELDIPDGLADPRVFVLDPCCGTGAYLVEVLRRIILTLKEDKGEGALAELAAKEAAMKRVFGFEIMPAPFVIAHLQMGLLLQNLEVPLDEKTNERAGIFLTNSLTGWDFIGENPQLKNWPELEAERAGADRVKQEKPILVILGNPPYNAYAGISPDEEQGLVEPYKEGLVKEWGIKKFNLDDLYVRFFRLAERRIAEKTGRGIVCYISNFSYLSDPSFVVMRQRFLREFDKLWFDCLNGDSRETGKLTPDGKPDPSVFSTEYNREGIRVGTAIALMVRRAKRAKAPEVHFRQFWGASKRADLLKSLKGKKFDTKYDNAYPGLAGRFSLQPANVTHEYLHWPSITALAQNHPFNGPIERRGNSLIVFENERGRLDRIADYLDEDVSDEEIRASCPEFMNSSGEFDAKKARAALKGDVKFNRQNIARYPFKPFDVRLAYLDADIQPLFSRPAPELLRQRFSENSFFITRDSADKAPEGPPFFFSSLVCDYDCISGHARHFPVLLLPPEKGQLIKKKDNNGEFDSILEEAEGAYGAGKSKQSANLSAEARAYLIGLKIKNPDLDLDAARMLWLHALAIGFANDYLTENVDGIKHDWPRIPLPDTKTALLKSAALGQKIAGLLDTQIPIDGLTRAEMRDELKTIAKLSSTKNLTLTAGWGHAGKAGVTMPGKGRLESREYAKDEVEFAKPDLLGKFTHDVYLNDQACWRNVPEKVWDYTIGGYQVIKKWLSYREHALLGRALTPDEAREVTNIARRIAALLLLAPELGANYQRVKAATYAWNPKP